MAQIFSPPKKIEATMPSGRKTYRYAGDSDTLKKKIAGLKKSGASGVSVVAEGVSGWKTFAAMASNDRKTLRRAAASSRIKKPKDQTNAPSDAKKFNDTKQKMQDKFGEEVTFKKGSPGEHLNKEKPLTPSKEKHHWADKGIYPKKADKSPLLKHRFFKQVSDPSKDDTKLIKKVTQKEETIQETSYEKAKSEYEKHIGLAKQHKESNPKKAILHRTKAQVYKDRMEKSQQKEETNLQELSPETIKSFMQKRLKKSVDHNKKAVDAADKGDKEGYKKHSGLQRKNFDGAMKAIRHAGNTLKRRAGMNEIAQQSIITHNIKSKDSNRPVVKKGTQLEGYYKKLDTERKERERLGGGTKPNVEKKKPSKAWSDIGYNNEKSTVKKKPHQSFQKGGKNDPNGLGALLHAESVKDYIEVKGGNMSKQEISKLIKNRKKEMEEGKKPGLWDNIHAKRARIKAGSGERMRKPGSKGAPTAQDFKDASESNVAFKNFLEARQIDERKGGATAGFLMRQLYLKRLMKRLNLPVSVAAMIDK